jgi:hypothetical protein
VIAFSVASVAYHHGARMRHASRCYQRRTPEGGVLFKVLRENLGTFLAEASAAESGTAGVPMFLQKELRNYLSCGVLSHGFARFRCRECNFERLVALSCKGRGFCPSCGGRSMYRFCHLSAALWLRGQMRSAFSWLS